MKRLKKSRYEEDVLTYKIKPYEVLQNDPYCYAYAKLARTYTGLYLKVSKIDPRRSGCQQKAVEMFAKASAVPTPDPRRIKWLKRYLFSKDILE